MVLHVTDDNKKEYAFDMDKLDLTDDSYLFVKIPTDIYTKDTYTKGAVVEMADKLRNCLNVGKRILFVPADLDFEVMDKDAAKKFFQDRIDDIENM